MTDLVQEVRDYYQTLPKEPLERAILVLHDVWGLTYEEIGIVFGCDQKSIEDIVCGHPNRPQQHYVVSYQ